MFKKAKYLLNSELEAERCQGIEILAQSGQLSGIELLAARLEKENSPYVQRRIIQAMGRTRCKWTAEATAKLLSSADAAVRNAALEIMHMLGVTAIPVLAELLHNPSRDLRKLATDALSKIPGDCSFSLLLSGLNDSDPNVVSAAVEALGTRNDLRAIPFLLELLEETESIWVGFGIMEALANLGNPDAMESILAYINKQSQGKQDKSVLYGIWAFTVGKLGNAQLLPEAWVRFNQGELSPVNMILLLDEMQQRGIDLEPWTPQMEELLERLKEDQGAEELLAAVHISISYCPNWLYNFLPTVVDIFAQRDEVLEKLITLLVKNKPDINSLVKYLTAAKEPLIKLVLSVVEQSELALPMPDIRMLTENADSEIVLRASALAWRCGAESKGLLSELLNHDNEEIVAVAVAGLGLIGDAECLQLVLQGLEHPSESVRRSAADTLIKAAPVNLDQELSLIHKNCPEYALPQVLKVIANYQDCPFLAEAFERAAASELCQVRVQSARISKLIAQDEVFLKVIQTLVNDPDQEVRRFAIQSMSGRRGEKVFQLLSYLYENETSEMNRYFLFNCDEIYAHPQIFDWLMTSIEQPNPLLKLAAVKGFVRFKAQGGDYLRMILNSPLAKDKSLVELIHKALEKNGGLGHDLESGAV